MTHEEQLAESERIHRMTDDEQAALFDSYEQTVHELTPKIGALFSSDRAAGMVDPAVEVDFNFDPPNVELVDYPRLKAEKFRPASHDPSVDPPREPGRRYILIRRGKSAAYLLWNQAQFLAWDASRVYFASA